MTARVAPSDQAVRDRLISGRDASVLVEAGAGTGKTSVMVQKIAGLIRGGEAEVSQIAAITYTDKAAAELKARLRGLLLESLTAAGGVERDRIMSALEHLESAAIGTIHSFAARILRENPVEAGLDPGFSITGEDADSADKLSEIWKKWRDRDAAANPEIWNRLLYLFPLDDRSDGMWRLAGSLAEHRDVLAVSELSEAAPSSDPVEAFGRLLGSTARLETVVRSDCKDSKADGLACACVEVFRLRRLEGLAGDSLAAQLLNASVPKVGNKGNKGNWRSGEGLKDAREIIKDMQAQLDDFRAGFFSAVLSEALQTARRAIDEMEREKKSQGILTFQDLLLYARDMLRDRKDARSFYQQRYKYVLVDEFQDTDPLQMELVLFLAEDGAKAADWSEVKIKPGKLFLVGDPKQSIYRFRRADIDLYRRVKEMMKPGVEYISVNFRSSVGIIKWVNDFFSALMAEEESRAAQADYVPLEAHRDDTPDGPAVAMIVPSDEANQGNADAIREAEAGHAAAMAKLIMESRDWSVRDPDTGEKRSIKPSDIGVLYPSRTGLPFYEEAFRAQGIPFVSDSGRDFYEETEVGYLLACLRAIENPHDAISVTAALTSVFFGFSDEDLFLHRAAGGSLDYTLAPPDGQPELSAALSFLNELHRARNDAPAFRTIRRLWWETGAAPLLMLRPRGRRIDSCLSLLADRGRIIQSSESLSFGRTVATLERERQAAREVAELTSPESGAEQVQLLTFHKAKGLEFPVVILVNLGSEKVSRAAKAEPIKILPLRFERRVEVAVRSPNGDQVCTPGFVEARAAEDSREEAENVRKFYVASTRARDHLIISCFGKSDPKTYLGYLKDLPDSGTTRIPAEGLRVLEEEDSPFGVPMRLDGAKQSKKTASELAERLDGLQAKISETVSKASVAPKVIRPSRSEPGALILIERGQKSEIGGPEVGDAFHEVMERIDFADPSGLDALARAACASRGVEQSTEAVAEWARWFLDSGLGRRAKAAGAATYREIPYSISRGADLLEGKIDLLFEETADETGATRRLVLVDYKTDNVTGKGLASWVERYREQLSLYAEAVELALGNRPDEVYVAFVRPGVAVSLALSKS